MSHRPIHFEIHADNPERAVAFYQAVFGWSFRAWDGPARYWLITTGTGGPGIDGGLMPRESPPAPAGRSPNAAVLTIGVTSCEETIIAITKHGGHLTVPRMAVPGVGYMAYAVDTESNTFGILQPDPAAA